MGLPMSYIRKKPKGYGRNARIEGRVSEGQNVLLVEDLTTDGGSKLSFVEAIRETGAKCMAENVGLDLVEISPNANPPVCKIMDFGKYKYEQQKRESEVISTAMRLGVKLQYAPPFQNLFIIFK